MTAADEARCMRGVSEEGARIRGDRSRGNGLLDVILRPGLLRKMEEASGEDRCCDAGIKVVSAASPMRPRLWSHTCPSYARSLLRRRGYRGERRDHRARGA